MRVLRLPANAKLWAVIGLMFIGALFAAAPVTLAVPSGAHADHHVSAAGVADHLSAVDHDHIGAAATQSVPDAFADALPPRMRIALPAVGLIFAVGLLWLLSPQHTALVGRDPPRAPAIASSGRDVLARVCISRR